jgi:hypothetical protein
MLLLVVLTLLCQMVEDDGRFIVQLYISLFRNICQIVSDECSVALVFN